jgi:hypothetical protein
MMMRKGFWAGNYRIVGDKGKKTAQKKTKQLKTYDGFANLME